jgi:5-formyltetrahydrofolate cyclo-ligase
LAQILAPLLANSRIVGGYCPLPSEISPLPALEAAAANGAIIAYPAFADHQAAFRFLAGEPSESGPWACFQPPLDAPEVFPDLVLVPLVAIDGKGTRLGQGKGHYDRVLAKLREHGALLIGLGWAVQKVDEVIPVDPWDVPLDGFASPEGLEMFR